MWLFRKVTKPSSQGRVHPWQPPTVSKSRQQRDTRDRQPWMHTLIPEGHLKKPINVIIVLSVGGSQSIPDRTHTWENMQTSCRMILKPCLCFSVLTLTDWRNAISHDSKTGPPCSMTTLLTNVTIVHPKYKRIFWIPIIFFLVFEITHKPIEGLKGQYLFWSLYFKFVENKVFHEQQYQKVHFRVDFGVTAWYFINWENLPWNLLTWL